MLMSAAFLVSALIQFALSLVAAFLLGPKTFGIYALGLAAAVIMQTLAFEWVRLAILRFYHPGDGQLAAMLKRAMRWLALAAITASALLFLFGGAHRDLLALLPLVALAAGYAEYRSAFLRARLDQRGYVAMTMARSLGAIILVPLVAHISGSASAVMAAYAASLVLGTLVGGRRDNQMPEAEAGKVVIALPTKSLLAYGVPIILTNLAYLGLFFVIRAHIALHYGVAEAGQFSLALEFGQKLVMTIGSALDLYLFQLAVSESRQGGDAQRRLRANGAIILAVLVPLLIGIWLVLPHIEVLVIAPAFREAFGFHLVSLLPGLAVYGVIQYVLHPFIQIDGRTSPLISAGLLALVLAVLVLGLASDSRILPFGLVLSSGKSSELVAGLAVLVGLLGAAALLLARIGMAAGFSFGALARLTIANAGMVIAVLFVRDGAPGMVTLFTAAGVGVAVYVVIAHAINLAGLRMLLPRSGK